MSGSCELHVAALPFPSYQGTQAALRQMLDARHAAGRDVELFTYGVSGYALVPPYPWHRTRRLAGVSLRSGPSWAKLALDARMGAQLLTLTRRAQPRVLIAHHVEAMSLACLIRGVPRVFFAHTDLAAELPSYAAAWCSAPLAAAGGVLDRTLCTSADAIAAISPALAQQLAAASGKPVQYVPTPWPLPEPTRAGERAAARRELGLPADVPVALYAGNLDAYQDAHSVLDALQLLAAEHGPRVCLLLATRSEPQAFLRRAFQLGVPVRTRELGAEPVRRLLHAAADCAVVPRAVPGGLPMKLLDALARGVPCALMPCASAGLPLTGCAIEAERATAGGLAAAVARVLAATPERRALAERARAYIAAEHSAERHGRALDALIARACHKNVAAGSRL